MTKSSRRRAKRQARKTTARRATARVQLAPPQPKTRPTPRAAPSQPVRLTVATVALRELTITLASPAAWIAGAVFILVVSGLGFFATSVAVRQATLSGVFGVTANFLVIILVALMTAGFGAGGRSGVWEVVAGRWLGAFALYGLLLGGTLVYVASIAAFGHGTTLDPGLVFATYLGLLLVGAAAIAIGVLAAALARNPVAGFLLAFGVLAVVWYAGYALGSVTVATVSSVLDYVAAYSRYQAFSLGLLPLRDAVYFLSLAAAALFVATRLHSSRRSRILASALAAAALLVAVNLAASGGTQVVDLTSGRLNTLEPPSVQAARQLQSDLTVIGLFRPGTGNGQSEAEALIGLYAAQSSHVKYQRANWDADTADVKRYRVKEPNTVVLDYSGKTSLLSPLTQVEHDFTAALLKLESNRVPVVCWATGDGGRGLSDNDQSAGYSGVADMLVKNDFTTMDLAITQVTSIPSGCDEVALVGATTALPPAAVKALDDYLAGGGSLLIASDPWQDPAITQALSSVLKPYGVGFSDSLVIEPDPAHAFDVITPAVLRYGASPITTDIEGVASFFPQSTAITGTPVAGASEVAIGAASAASYAIDRARQELKRQGGDTPGPFTIMETLEKAAGLKATRIAVIGTAAFAENRVLPPNSTDGNLDLALATFQWLAGQDLLASVPAKPRRSPLLALTQQDQNLLIFITVVGMPALMVAAAAMLWWRRRRAR